MATISAIITTYNYGRFIADAIECTLAQTRRPDEIIVVDDGSTDNTAEIVARYANRGVRYIYKQNGGAGSARNAGLAAAKGDLIAFLDSDDRWVPEKLALQEEHLERYPKAGLVTASERQVYVDSDQEPFVLHRPAIGAANLYRQTLVENVIGNPSLTLIRRACFDKVGNFDESLRLGQDWDMWIRIAKEFAIGIIDTPLINFTRHTRSLTAGQMSGRMASNELIRRRYIGGIKSPLERLRLMSAAHSMSYYYAAAGLADDPACQWEARRLATLSLLLDPLYESKLKVGVFVRALFGRQALKSLRRLMPG